MKTLGLLFLLLSAALHAAPTIPNPSFESNAAYTVFPGYITGNSPISGWTASDPDRVGLNPGASFFPFSDNGAIPDGSRVALIQSVGSKVTLSTTLTGLTMGTVYHLKFRTNARGGPTFPTGSYQINGAAPVIFFARPVGGSNPYLIVSDFFTATGTTATLAISNTTPIDSTLLVDDFKIEAATNLIVTNNGDSGAGSLRAALAAAAASTTEFNAISFANALNGATITLNSELAVTDASGVAIDASALGNGLTISGGTGNNRIFNVEGASTRMFLRRLSLTSGNVASADGGAIQLHQGTLSLNQCTLWDNSSPSSGGAILNLEGTLSLRQCTLFGNESPYGGAIYSLFSQNTTLVQCTLVNNTATVIGGAIRNVDGRMFLSHCTISANVAPSGEGGGVSSYGNNDTETVVDRCIITGNANSDDVDLEGINNSFTSGGRNIVGGGQGVADFNVNDLTGQNAQLSPLAYNGGPTQTMAIGPGSPARSAAVGSVITTDQRGRPLFGGADAGAFELQSGTFSLSASAYRVREGEPVVITINRGADVADFTTVRLITKPGTATAADFTPRAGDNSSNVDFFQGDSSSQVSIPTTADLLLEGDHRFTVELSLFGVTDGSAIVTAPITATVTIAEPIQVTTTADDGPGSLRQAFHTAAAVSGPDAIHFSPKLNGQTITLGRAIVVDDAGGVVVDASNLPMGIALDGAGYSRIFYVGEWVPTSLTLRGFTLTGGNGQQGNPGKGGAIFNSYGNLTLERCTLTRNSADYGGAIVNDSGNLTLERCTLSGNSASVVGGAIENTGVLTLTQCTLSGNTADDFGGAILSSGRLTLTQCTLSGNTADSYGGAISSIGSLALNRSIVAGNSAPGDPSSADISNFDTIDFASGTSIVRLLGGPGITNNPGNRNTADPLLAPLADNGGPTMTHALLPGSPARDAGTGSPFTQDQRGVNVVGTPDVGAYEVTRGGVFTFTKAGYMGHEGDSVTITITRSGGSKDAASVILSAISGTASNADHDWLTLPVNFSDNQVSRSFTINLTAPDGVEANEFFSLKLTPNTGGATVGTPATAKVYIVDQSATGDTALPSATKVLTPKANTAIGVDVGGTVTLSGTATDERGVTYVEVFDSSLSYLTDTLVDFPGAKTSTWSTTVTPATGANTFSFITYDSRPPSGNQSNIISHTFKVLRPLLVKISGFGSVTTGYFPKSYREVGKPHSLTATTGSGYLFAGWSILSGHTAGDIGVTLNALQLPTLNFIHREGLALRANFALSPFTPQVAGTYVGLIGPNSGIAYTLDTLGQTTFKVQSNGAFTGTLKIDGGSIPLSGIFDSTGKARFGANRQEVVTLLRKDKPALLVDFNLDITLPLFGAIMGNIRTLEATPRTLILQSLLCPYSKTNPVPGSYLGANGADGIYTAVILPKPNPGFTTEEYPQGTGFFTTKISRTGAITMKGELADGTAFSMTTMLNSYNNWALFSPLYGAKGLLIGTNGPSLSDPNFDFTMMDSIWMRPVLDTQHYAAGWPEGILVDIGGAKYTATAGTSIVPGLPGTSDASLQFTSVALGLNQLYTMQISAADIANAAAGLRIKIDRKTGVFSGTFDYGPNTGGPYKGIILNKSQTTTSPCQGYFLSPTPKVKDYTGQGGAVKLQR